MATENKSYYDSYDSFKSTGIGEFGEIPMSKWDSGLCKKISTVGKMPKSRH